MALSRAIRAVRLTGAVALLVVLAHAETTGPLGFAVIADALTRPADEAPVRRMLDAIGRDGNIAFIVYDGNFKGGAEPCRDSIYQARHDLLDASRTPLVVLLGQHDWADCGQAQASAYDPVERLDFVRQLFFSDASSLGQTPLTLSRESDVARFRTFREIVRWQAHGVAFIGLNVPSPNNHYLSAGGRNGEFEDRAVATAFWLEHAAESARRTDMRALVIFLQADPDFSRYERRERFAWLRFSRSNQPRDGFLELKRSLVKAAEAFRGPVIVIHETEASEPNGFRIDQPLRNDKGLIVTNLTRIAVAFKKPQSQWLEVQSDAHWHPPFRLRVRTVPAGYEARAGEASAAASEAPAQPGMPSMPYSSAQPAQSTLPASMPCDDRPESLPAPPTMPLSTSDLPPILTPPQFLPPILPVPASGVQNGRPPLAPNGSGQ
ncbi:unnamed protein product [Candidatus Paraburkholderia kirkii UZHbot1]|uniref:WGS project CAFE00000000 data, contig bkir_c6 n=1 Tax=Candidatus Paraburkholderia kirkii UZHbot1 TaxID=1055526 RepID=U3UAY6_9BURK|nr:unnamed protein product [Candidatus Paraburkholderia kirkii UZHbot1]